MAKRIAVTALGGALLVGGLVLMVLPGPGILLVAGGLAVLATEYAWARRLVRRARVRAQRAQRAAVSSPARTAGSLLFGVGMVCLGVAMQVVDDVPWPVQDALLDAVWRPLTGWLLVATGVVLLVTTAVALRAERARASRPGRSEQAARTDERRPAAAASGGARPLA